MNNIKIFEQDKIEYILSLEEKTYLSDDEWTNLEVLSKDNYSEVRFRIAELLAFFPCNNSELLLLSMCNDDDKLVRTSVCDSLSFSCSPETLNILIKHTKDRSFLVRGYAILSIGDIQSKINNNDKEVINYLKQLYCCEKSEWVKIALSRSLFILGEMQFWNDFIKNINNRYYKNRCFVLNLIKELIDKNYNTPELFVILNNRLNIEKAYSVKTNLQSIIKKIEMR